MIITTSAEHLEWRMEHKQRKKKLEQLCNCKWEGHISSDGCKLSSPSFKLRTHCCIWNIHPSCQTSIHPFSTPVLSWAQGHMGLLTPISAVLGQRLTLWTSHQFITGSYLLHLVIYYMGHRESMWLSEKCQSEEVRLKKWVCMQLYTAHGDHLQHDMSLVSTVWFLLKL